MQIPGMGDMLKQMQRMQDDMKKNEQKLAETEFFGKAGGVAVELSDVVLGVGGFVISGHFGEESGSSVSSAGDANADGLSDVAVGGWYWGLSEGRSYVVYSPLSPAGSGTYRMRTLAGDGPGGLVAPITDFGDVARAKIDFSDDDFASGGGLNGASDETVTITRSGAAISHLPNHTPVFQSSDQDNPC